MIMKNADRTGRTEEEKLTEVERSFYLYCILRLYLSVNACRAAG